MTSALCAGTTVTSEVTTARAFSEDKHHRKLAFYELQKFYGQK